jgi:dihydrofolate reductase
MGQATFLSIGKALPNRTNIILSKDKEFKADNCKIACSINEGIELAKKSPGGEESFVIGGGQIYKQMIDLADKLYLTVVDDSPEADTYFPDYSKFRKIVNEKTVETDNLKYTFLELEK